MPAKMHRVVVDTHSNALLGLLTCIMLILLTSSAAILIRFDLIRSVIPGEDSSPQAPAIFSNAFLGWFVWKEPLVTLAVIVPLAIALQVAVHGLRAEQNWIGHVAANAIRVRDHEIRRVRLFSQIANFSAGLVLVFTGCTVLAEVFGYDGEPDGALATTVALSGVVTALLCLDAARVATTQDLEKRLSQEESLVAARKKILARLKRDLPARRRRLWFSSYALAVILIFPGVFLDLYFPLSAEPASGWRGVVSMIVLMIAAFIVLVLWLALYFLVLVAMTLTTIMTFALQVLFWLLAADLTWALISFAFRDDGPTNLTYLYIWIWVVFPTIAFISAVIAWVQGSRGSSSWVTKCALGFPDLLRLLSARIMARLVRNSHNKVSWLREVLRNSMDAISLPPAKRNRNCTQSMELSQPASQYRYRHRPGR